MERLLAFSKKRGHILRLSMKRGWKVYELLSQEATYELLLSMKRGWKASKRNTIAPAVKLYRHVTVNEKRMESWKKRTQRRRLSSSLCQ